jgi:hypothetical protein
VELCVTGVQTCALPISLPHRHEVSMPARFAPPHRHEGSMPARFALPHRHQDSMAARFARHHPRRTWTATRCARPHELALGMFGDCARQHDPAIDIVRDCARPHDLTLEISRDCARQHGRTPGTSPDLPAAQLRGRRTVCGWFRAAFAARALRLPAESATLARERFGVRWWRRRGRSNEVNDAFVPALSALCGTGRVGVVGDDSRAGAIAG